MAVESHYEWDVAVGTQASLPSTDFAAIRPTLQMVADLVRTRTILDGGTATDTFTPETYPTDSAVERLIDQATNAIYIQLPGSLAEPWAPAAMHLSALYAAILVEASYFREQLTDDQVELYRNLLIAGINGLGAAAGSGGSSAKGLQAGSIPGPVDSIVMRGLADADPLYLATLSQPDANYLGSAGTQLEPIGIQQASQTQPVTFCAVDPTYEASGGDPFIFCPALLSDGKPHFAELGWASGEDSDSGAAQDPTKPVWAIVGGQTLPVQDREGNAILWSQVSQSLELNYRLTLIRLSTVLYVLEAAALT